MLEKKYCFVPESHKLIRIFQDNPATPLAEFKYCIDENDKIKLFYVEKKNIPNSIEDNEYFIAKTTTAIKALFKTTELVNYKLIIDNSPRVEFSIYYDADGNQVYKNELNEKVKLHTVLEHRYTYNFYKKYE